LQFCTQCGFYSQHTNHNFTSSSPFMTFVIHLQQKCFSFHAAIVSVFVQYFRQTTCHNYSYITNT
jgi:hypothetical protein